MTVMKNFDLISIVYGSFALVGSIILFAILSFVKMKLLKFLKKGN